MKWQVTNLDETLDSKINYTCRPMTKLTVSALKDTYSTSILESSNPLFDLLPQLTHLEGLSLPYVNLGFCITCFTSSMNFENMAVAVIGIGVLAGFIVELMLA